MTETFTVGPPDAGKRVDTFLADRIPDLSRTLARELIELGKVLVGERPVKPSRRVAPGEVVQIDLVLPSSLTATPEKIPLSIVYEDRDLAVIDKPAGLVVHPAPGHQSGTLANALTALYPAVVNSTEPVRPGIVHRLDKDTSGLMVVALNPAAQASLQKQIADREAKRTYLALAGGDVSPLRGTIDTPVGRDPYNRKRMTVHGIAARSARTSYEVLEYLPGFTFLEAKLATGRTHQIRVHFAGLGHPLAGDRTYGGPSIPGLWRQFLHSHSLSIRSPATGRTLHFSSALPADLAVVLGELRSKAESEK